MSQTIGFGGGDWLIEENGQPLLLEGYDKVQQDIIHALAFPYDSEIDYGNESYNTEIRVVGRFGIPGIIQNDFSAAISRLRKFQSFIPRQHLPDNERITGIKNILVEPLDLGAQVLITVSVAARSAQDVRQVFRVNNAHLEGRGH
jgi:hypothetical protein